MKAIRIISMMMLLSLTASAQEKKEINWLEELKSRITINGYMQGGYEYSETVTCKVVTNTAIKAVRPPARSISSAPSSGEEHALLTAGRLCS